MFDFIHIYRPPQDPTEPILLLLHGTGGDEHDLLPLAEALRPGAGVLSVRGNVSENGQNRFFRRLAEGVFDLEDLDRRTDALAAFIRDASSTYRFDPKMVIAVGYSNGANIAVGLLLRHPSALSRAILFRPMMPYQPSQRPELSGMPVFIGAGEHDHMVPMDQVRRLRDVLQAGGADVTVHVEPAGHGLTPGDVEAAQAWISTIR